MSPAFIKGVADSLPKAAVTFDKFHAVKIVNDAVDQVRRTERKDHKLLRRHTLHLAAQPGQPVRTPARHTRKSTVASSQDRACLPDPSGIPGTIRSADGGAAIPQTLVLLGHPQPARANDRGWDHDVRLS